MKTDRLIGCRLKRDLVSGDGVLLLSEKTILTETHVQFIENHQIVISSLDLEALPQEGRTNEGLVGKASEEIKEIFNQMRKSGTIPVEEVQRSIIPTIHQATEFPNLFSILTGLQAKDDYTYRHNIGVGVISTMIGKWLRLNEEDLALLTLAATLHDVGKIKIEDEILNKPGKFTHEEYERMKKHTTYGYEIIQRTSGMHPRVALVALQHHERMDGRGYPQGLTGEEIDYFSKIVAVADVFHAMTSKRIYKQASPFYQVMKQMVSDAYGILDPIICNTFVRRMMEMAIGSSIRLTDGRIGRIAMVHHDDPTNPLIWLDNQFLDLRKHPYLDIERLVG